MALRPAFDAPWRRSYCERCPALPRRMTAVFPAAGSLWLQGLRLPIGNLSPRTGQGQHRRGKAGDGSRAKEEGTSLEINECGRWPHGGRMSDPLTCSNPVSLMAWSVVFGAVTP